MNKFFLLYVFLIIIPFDAMALNDDITNDSGYKYIRPIEIDKNYEYKPSTVNDEKNLKKLVCTFSPNQHDAKNIFLTASTATLSALAVMKATGLTAVLHSSGAYIFTGSSGYIAGTLGGASVVPIIVNVSLVVVSGTIALEMICAEENSEYKSRIFDVAKEFSYHYQTKFLDIPKNIDESLVPKVSKISIETKKSVEDIFKYVFQK